ncbi:hypothetical protein NDU88_003815 [Pleurodeles waltl]|uniref:Uncharacterized protein n=1 Tax=Pleurodeles waltl TaxID=8319 RepID=A0AAV7PHY9_PLEWA|nr:hypothetical protein NDU88_003815 [Pleurodeles waltl]
METPEKIASEVPDSEASKTENLNGSKMEDDPLEVERTLVNLLLGAAKVVHLLCHAAEQVNDSTEDPRAMQALAVSKEVFLNAQKIGYHLLAQLKYSDFESLFKSQQPFPVGYQDFQRFMLECESGLQNQPSDEDTKFRSANCCNLCGLSLGPYDGAPCKTENYKPAVAANVCFHDQDTGVDVAGSHQLALRSRSPSFHKQLEALRIEEHMGGMYITERRRSPRRSPSSGTDGMSPLVSEEEFSSMKPVSLSPSRKSSTKFLNKLMRRSKPEGLECESEPIDGKGAW